jgi:hypothetical protein
MTDQPPIRVKPGQLTQAQSDQAVAFLKERWGLTIPCPFHPATPTKWVVDQNVGQIPGYAAAAALGLSGLTFPILIVTCQTCGFIVPINAIRAGVIEPDSAEVHEKADAPTSEGK